MHKKLSTITRHKPDNSPAIAMHYRLDSQGIWVLIDERGKVFLFHSIYTGSETDYFIYGLSQNYSPHIPLMMDSSASRYSCPCA
jgi:hypothetical protein